jgi:hypothetical protein
MVREIFGTKREEVTKGQRYITMMSVITGDRLGLQQALAIQELCTKCEYAKPERKISLRRPGHRWEDNNKMGCAH